MVIRRSLGLFLMMFIESSRAFEAMIDLICGHWVDGIENGGHDVGVVDMY